VWAGRAQRATGHPQTADNKWFSDKTGKTYDTCDYRYILRANVADFSGSNWVNGAWRRGKYIHHWVHH